MLLTTIYGIKFSQRKLYNFIEGDGYESNKKLCAYYYPDFK